jgi:hypothetical protein
LPRRLGGPSSRCSHTTAPGRQPVVPGLATSQVGSVNSAIKGLKCCRRQLRDGGTSFMLLGPHRADRSLDFNRAEVKGHPGERPQFVFTPEPPKWLPEHLQRIAHSYTGHVFHTHALFWLATCSSGLLVTGSSSRPIVPGRFCRSRAGAACSQGGSRYTLCGALRLPSATRAHRPAYANPALTAVLACTRLSAARALRSGPEARYEFHLTDSDCCLR